MPRARSLILARICRKCRRDLPIGWFRRQRKTCKECQGYPPPTVLEELLVVPRPRPVRRPWPDHVVHEVPFIPEVLACEECGMRFEQKRRHQKFCEAACRHAARNRRRRKA